MGVKWTKEQQKVIDVRNKDVLVSAAAGSGKTAVLVERILSLVCGDKDGDTPVDVDRLLVVTFTNAAAAEMRERIGLALLKRLEEEPENVHLQKQQTLIHNAQITTIHSFCQYVIRSYFHQLDLDPSFRIGDEGELKLLKGEVLEELLEDRYKEKSPEFVSFVETYAVGKSDRPLEDLILQLYEFSISYPYPRRWLEGCMETYGAECEEELNQSRWMRFLLDFAGKLLAGWQEELKGALALCGEADGPYMYQQALLEDLEQAEALGSCRTYEEYQEGLEHLAFARLSAKRDSQVDEGKKARVKALRDRMKKSLKDLKETYFASSLTDVFELLQRAAVPTGVLISLTAEFADRYQEKKRNKNLADFSDLEHLALEILAADVKEEEGAFAVAVTDAARELSERYVQIMIDEYQDSNLIQEIILNSVSRRERGCPNVFMVGDVKQSIYRFRLARPELFMEKYHTYPQTEEGDALRIDLHKNFRSREEVLQGVNELFYRLMTPGVGGIRYDEGAALYLGASMPEPEEGLNQPELLLLDKDAPELSGEEADVTAREMEAYAAAERIKELLACQQVWDGKREAFRPASYGDIVILLRSLTGWGDVYARVLTEAGIPAHTESRTGYFTTVEIQTLLNLLRVVDNPRQDIPLAAVLKSMIGGFSDGDLALVKSRYPDRPFYEACMSFYQEAGEQEAVLAARMEAFYQRLNRYRSKADYLPIHEFLWFILEDTGYGDYLAAQPGGVQREANVRMLVERAISFEKTSYRGLFHFVRYMEQLQSYQEDFGEAGITGENEDAVRIMTIHKSKGLEFPIVIVGGLGKSFNRQDTRSRVVIHPDLGLGVDYVDAERRVKIPLLPKKALQRALDLEMLGEELRVLYVAFTRAKEKLILLGSTKKPGEKLEGCQGAAGREPLSFSVTASAGTYLDWILPASAGSSFALSQVQPKLLLEEAVGQQISMEELWERLRCPEELPGEDAAFAEEIDRRFGEVYPYEEEISLRVKVSVSELKKAGQTEEEDADTFLYPQEEIVPYIPRFMQEEEPVSGAARGTAYHRVLECLDLSGLYHSDKVREAMERLVEEGRLTRAQADVVRPYDIYAFGKTKLAERMTAARRKGKLYTEQPFVIKLPACDLDLGYQSREPVLIQGIIDAYFYEEDGIVVVDYKTDYVKEGEELLEKYGRQLDYYETALEKLTGKKVKEKVIYSFCLGKCVERYYGTGKQ
ncbi:ATP-dependent helicase/nuclease subunit A [Lachnospiraceae bacterium]|nr:ATP-dependent helicase/nuclease subunit A [Lachnospiraceae bacterium]